MRQSPLAEATARHGAVWRAEAGWEVAVHYGDPGIEDAALHRDAGLRDASHWTRLRFSGRDHLEFLHRMTTNHFRDLRSSCGMEAVFADNRGRILELGTFYRADDTVLAVLSPGGRERIPAWLDRYLFAEQVDVRDLADGTAMLELLGPRAGGLAAQVLGCDLGAVPTHGLVADPADGGLWVARVDAGYPGLRAIGTPVVLRQLWERFEVEGARPVGEAAWQVLRIELGWPWAGHELTEEHNPWEAGLGYTVHPAKGCYIGQEVIARLDAYDKVKQRLVGLRWNQGGMPNPGTALTAEGREAGYVTSVAHSTHLRSHLALAYLRRGYWEPGTRVALGTGAGHPEAEVASLPFAGSG